MENKDFMEKFKTSDEYTIIINLKLHERFLIGFRELLMRPNTLFYNDKCGALRSDVCIIYP